MNEQECLDRMVPPGQVRPRKWRGGVIQLHVTRACDRSCYGCTQGSNLAGKPVVATPEQFEVMVRSLRGYWGVVGIFGGNPAMHPQFPELCAILRRHFPQEQCGLWSNRIFGHGAVCRRTFNPAHSNLNVHMDRGAYEEMWATWPEARRCIKGLEGDSRHSPPFVAMHDVLPDEGKRWELISGCDINQYWSALVGVIPGRGVRAYFCEIAYAQAALHAADPAWPDLGLDPAAEYEVHTRPGQRAERTTCPWWQLPMQSFAEQVRWHCHRCGVPLRGYGELACAPNAEGVEQVSRTHADVYRPKHKGRRVELLVVPPAKTLARMTQYLENATAE